MQCTKANEEWTQCGPRCGESCADQGKQIACSKVCALQGGCSCKQGYARDSNGECISKTQCPSNYADGNSGCPPGVPLVHCFVNPCAITNCSGVNGAQCKAICGGCYAQWFLNGRDVTEQCRESNSNCAVDEEYLSCGPTCPPQCGDEITGACAALCKSGCFCKQGLVRGPDNRCIKRKDCPSIYLPTCDVMLCANGCLETLHGGRCVDVS